ncbi:MAG: hypothetical protein RL346_1482 [Verrucomicrobiota bacterium]
MPHFTIEGGRSSRILLYGPCALPDISEAQRPGGPHNEKRPESPPGALGIMSCRLKSAGVELDDQLLIYKRIDF